MLLVIGLLSVNASALHAQYEYLVTLNYQDLRINRVKNIPGITWINSDCSAYDQNHQRFFFSGGPNNQAPWYLYSLDAVSGNIIYQSRIPSNNDSIDAVLGLQYDNVSDTLYGLFFSRVDQLITGHGIGRQYCESAAAVIASNCCDYH